MISSLMALLLMTNSTGVAGDSPAAKIVDAPTLKLGPMPEIRLAPAAPSSPEKIAEIKKLIAGLALVDKPDFGFSTSLSGVAFAPLPGRQETGPMVLTNHHLQVNDKVKSLVELGPEAIPYLLAALEDKTPSRLVIKREGIIMSIGFHQSLPQNKANQRGQDVVSPPETEEEHRQLQGLLKNGYALTVGDLSFVILGQIVGRPYQACQYRPTACLVLTCPSQCPNLVRQLRQQWQAPDSRELLFHSLLADFVTEATAASEKREALLWRDRAALRLLYYFPNESQALICKVVTEEKSLTPGFLNAINWSRQAPIRRSLTEYYRQSSNPFAIPGVDDQELLYSRLLESYAKIQNVSEGGDKRLLGYFVEYLPAKAAPILKDYLKDKQLGRSVTVSQVLSSKSFPGDLDFLLPMLSDQRVTTESYATEERQDSPRLPLRLCDYAAWALSRMHPEMKFVVKGSHADLDLQIGKIQAQRK